MKEFRKSVNIWSSYEVIKYGGLLFVDHLVDLLYCILCVKCRTLKLSTNKLEAASVAVCLCDGTDGPHIDCDSLDVALGQRNVCLRCQVTARPAPTAVYWQSGSNNTDVISDDAHWVVVQVNS